MELLSVQGLLIWLIVYLTAYWVWSWVINDGNSDGDWVFRDPKELHKNIDTTGSVDQLDSSWVVASNQRSLHLLTFFQATLTILCVTFNADERPPTSLNQNKADMSINVYIKRNWSLQRLSNFVSQCNGSHWAQSPFKIAFEFLTASDFTNNFLKTFKLKCSSKKKKSWNHTRIKIQIRLQTKFLIYWTKLFLKIRYFQTGHYCFYLIPKRGNLSCMEKMKILTYIDRTSFLLLFQLQ